MEQLLFINTASSGTLQLTKHISSVSKTELQDFRGGWGQAGGAGLSGHLEHWWPAGVQVGHTA